jgi:putative transposase
MARPLRLSFENAVYHVTARGNRRENIFYSDKDKSIFLEKMNEIVKGVRSQHLSVPSKG